MAQFFESSIFTGDKGVIHDLIRLKDGATKDELTHALYKSIEQAHIRFIKDLQEKIKSEKNLNWKSMNLDYFDDIEELLRQRKDWAKVKSR
jgi:hypothetical protein